MHADERHLPPNGGTPRQQRAAARVGALALTGLVLSLMVLCILCTGGVMQALDGSPAAFKLIDFHSFYIVGTLAGAGHLADAYTWSTMGVLEDALGFTPGQYMPHAYPPLFGLLLAPLARLPIGTAYAVFIGTTFLGLIGVIQWIAGRWLWPAVLAAAPVVLMNVLIGQNGLLTAGLAGLSAGLALAGRRGAAGAAAGMLAALKPQIALGLTLQFLLRRDRRAGLGMVSAMALLYGAAALILSPAIIPAWLTGLSETSHSLMLGRFPVYRMTSIYACLLTLGAPSWVAVSAHAAAAAGVVAILARMVPRACDERSATGLCLFATPFFSPYFYDYDLAVLVPALALALPALARRSTPLGLGALLVALATIGCLSAMQSELIPVRISLSGPALLACFLIVAAKIGGPAPAQDNGLRHLGNGSAASPAGT